MISPDKPAVFQKSDSVKLSLESLDIKSDLQTNKVGYTFENLLNGTHPRLVRFTSLIRHFLYLLEDGNATISSFIC